MHQFNAIRYLLVTIKLSEMSFGGSVAAMISSLKANKRHRISTFDKIKQLKKGKHTAVSFENKAPQKNWKNSGQKFNTKRVFNLSRKVVSCWSLLHY